MFHMVFNRNKILHEAIEEFTMHGQATTAINTIKWDDVEDLAQWCGDVHLFLTFPFDRRPRSCIWNMVKRLELTEDG